MLKDSRGSLVDQVDMDAIEDFCREIYKCDEYTLSHVQHVADLMAGLASQLGMSCDEINLAYMVGVIHDVGKVKTPDAILHKPGRLTPDEFEVMKQHAGAGASMLSSVAGAGPIVPVMRHHHERFDGKGYPDGLEKYQIPTLSRMLAICDSFDAMITHRCYREPISLRNSLLELRRCEGTQFDPDLCEAFIEFIYERFGFSLQAEEQQEELTEVAAGIAK